MKYKFLILFIGMSIFCYKSYAQYANTVAEKQNKFFLANSNLYFASYDENYINDSIISGYCIKDIRGMVIANATFKVGKKINAEIADENLYPYTEIVFVKNYNHTQLSGFVCALQLQSFFQSLLYTSSSKNYPTKFTSTYELDYEKVENLCSPSVAIYNDKIDQQYNPINDYYNIINYTKNTSNCSSKIIQTKPKPKPIKYKKYVPKKLL